MIIFFEDGGNILTKPKEKTPHPRLSRRPLDESATPDTAGHFYHIHVKGQLSDMWADWFDGMAIEYLDDDRMLLSGYVADQSALMGILNKLVHLNLSLISLDEVKNKKEKI